MSRGLKGIIIILIIAVLTIAGVIILPKIDLVGQETQFNVQNKEIKSSSIEIRATEDTAISPAVTAQVTSPPPTEKPIITVTPSPAPTQEPQNTPVPIPIIPESNTNNPQIITDSYMNGYIYLSYESEKKVKVMMECNGKSEVYDLIGDGKFHRFTLHLGEGDYLIRLVENTSGKSYRVVKTQEFKCKLIDEIFPYLFPNSYVMYDNDMEIIQFGLGLTQDVETREAKARALYDWIVRNIKYDFSVLGKLEVGYVPNPQRTFDTKLGICSDFAVLFASMCRSQGIPCKVALGYYVKTEYYHAWNEVLYDGEYHIVDASGDSQTKKYNFTRTDGYTKTKEH
ncbi:MAG: hypothetical protein KAQ68_00705 [Clostridiales bacterium]|nr:hypothetical protein [Clostridiales bacterium]